MISEATQSAGQHPDKVRELMHTACVLDDAERGLRALWLRALETASGDDVMRLVDASRAARRAIRALDDVLESHVM